MTADSPTPPALLSRLGSLLRSEAAGGALLLLATLAALILANSGLAPTYFGVRGHHLDVDLGPLPLHLSLGHWASDGLLAVFFFLVGLELKKEILDGDLRDPGKALVPVAAAVGGVIVPALIFLGVTAMMPDSPAEAARGWAVPTATDIAFAVAVLAVIGRNLPSALRLFLLTLAVVDDLLAITIIAVFYTEQVHLLYLGLAVLPLLAYALLAQRLQAVFLRRVGATWLLLLPLGFLVWALFVGSGIHATIAGVLLGLCVPVLPGRRTPDDAGHSLAEAMEHHLRPLSAGVCVPVFAFLSAGVAVGGWSGFAEAATSPAGLGVVLGLVLGKAVGITGATWLVTRLPGTRLDPSLRWLDVVGVSLLAGIGFTVSLLIAELGFEPGSALNDAAKIGILTGSAVAALAGAAVLGPRSRARA